MNASYLRKLLSAVVLMNCAVVVVAQNGILECGCFKSDADTKPNATSFEDSMSGCLAKCDKLGDCIGFGFNVGFGRTFSKKNRSGKFLVIFRTDLANLSSKK